MEVFKLCSVVLMETSSQIYHGRSSVFFLRSFSGNFFQKKNFILLAFFFSMAGKGSVLFETLLKCFFKRKLHKILCPVRFCIFLRRCFGPKFSEIKNQVFLEKNWLLATVLWLKLRTRAPFISCVATAFREPCAKHFASIFENCCDFCWMFQLFTQSEGFISHNESFSLGLTFCGNAQEYVFRPLAI